MRGGSLVEQAVTIENSGPMGGEALDGNAGAVTGEGAGTGAFTLLAPGGTSTAVEAGLNTTSDGGVVEWHGGDKLRLRRDRTDGQGTTTLLPQTIDVSGTVYRLASAGVR